MANQTTVSVDIDTQKRVKKLAAKNKVSQPRMVDMMADRWEATTCKKCGSQRRLRGCPYCTNKPLTLSRKGVEQ